MQLARSFKNRKNDTWFHCHKHIWRFQESTLEKQKNKKTLSFFRKTRTFRLLAKASCLPKTYVRFLGCPAFSSRISLLFYLFISSFLTLCHLHSLSVSKCNEFRQGHIVFISFCTLIEETQGWDLRTQQRNSTFLNRAFLLMWTIKYFKTAVAILPLKYAAN